MKLLTKGWVGCFLIGISISVMEVAGYNAMPFGINAIFASGAVLLGSVALVFDLFNTVESEK